MARGWVVGVVLGLAMAVPVPGAVADPGDVPVAGSGSTWASNAVDQWRRAVSQQPGLRVQYAATGSSSGRSDFRAGIVDFAVSELEYSADDPPPAAPFTYLPLVAGGTALAYNLRVGGGRISDLRLSGDTVAKIFTSVITSWDDPAIRADNPGLALPALPITLVVRVDAASNTMQFTRWLADRHSALWNDFCARTGRSPCGPTTSYPLLNGMVALGSSSGVAGFVAQDPNVGAITYVEHSYARAANLPEVNLRNEAGNFVGPGAANVTAALRSAVIRPDATQDPAPVYRSPDPDAYPLSGYAYVIVPTAVRPSFTTAKGRTLSQFLNYATCAGQSMMDALGYAPLPSNLIQAALSGIPAIPGAVAPVPCANPGPPREILATEVLPGALTITVDDQDVTLPSPVLTADARMLTTAGRLNPIRVTDTRAGDPGWTLSGQVSDFLGGTATINAANLGWAPELRAASPSQQIVTGPVVDPAQALDPGVEPPPGIGLRTSRTLAGTAQGHGLGTADLAAALSLTVPTSTTAGTYTAILSLTVI